MKQETEQQGEQKPIRVYIAANFGGGVRKSTTMAYLYMSLKSLKEDPIMVGLDTNDTLKDLLPKGTPLTRWDLNNQDQSQQNLEAVIQAAYKTQKSVIIDIAALGGDSLGVHTLIDTGIFEVCELIAVVPTLPSAKSITEGYNALAALNPSKWMLVQYDTYRNQAIYDRIPEFKQLVGLSPAAIIKPAELTDGNASTLRDSSHSIEDMQQVTLQNPIGSMGLRIFVKFWTNLKPQLVKGIKSL